MITRRNLPHEVVHGTPSEIGMSAPSHDFPAPGLSEAPQQVRALLTDSQSLNLAEREKAALMAALDQCNGNKKKAAELLGIHRPTLYTKLKKFGLDS
jgi:transcriptional regulator of acetoin/glycerol metabolism